MSKNSFKKKIQERYRGRGNTWVKVLKGTEAYNIFENKLNSINDANDFLNHVEREGFGWVRFSKVEGDEKNPIEVFELRYRGSKFDHIDCTIEMSHNAALEMPLLGNTPLKLQLETNPDKRKEKPVSFIKKSASLKEENDDFKEEVIDVVKEIKIIKEATLTKPSDKELENWYEFLKLNDLYEENV